MNPNQNPKGYRTLNVTKSRRVNRILSTVGAQLDDDTISITTWPVKRPERFEIGLEDILESSVAGDQLNLKLLTGKFKGAEITLNPGQYLLFSDSCYFVLDEAKPDKTN